MRTETNRLQAIKNGVLFLAPDLLHLASFLKFDVYKVIYTPTIHTKNVVIEDVQTTHWEAFWPKVEINFSVRDNGNNRVLIFFAVTHADLPF